MARPGITYSEVANAATQLQGQHKAPTVENVRQLLQTGSNSTLAKYLREWKAHQGIETHAEGALPAELLALVKGLWQHLQDKAETTINEQQHVLDKKLEVNEQYVKEAHQHTQQLQQQLEQQIAVYEEQIQINQNLQQQYVEEQKAHSKQLARATGLEQQLAQQTLENERLHQLVKHLQANLEHYQTATQTLREEQVLVIEKQRHQYEQRLQEAQQQLTQTLQNNVQLQSQVEQGQEKIGDFEKRFMHVQTKLEALNTEHQKQTHELQTLHAQNTTLKQNYQQQFQVLESKQQYLTQTEIELKLLAQQHQRCEKELHQLHEKLHTLQDTHQTVLQDKAIVMGKYQQLQASLKINYKDNKD